MATNPTMGLFVLKSAVSIGKQKNHTTICRPTNKPGINIQMSFLAERPPIPSKLLVQCPNLSDHEKPLILSMVDDFFLVRVVIACPGRLVTSDDQRYDYFIYNPTLCILDQLPHPHPFVFYPNQVGLLPRGDQYTVAALVPKRNPFMYELYLFNSEAESWKSKSLLVSTQLRKFPDEIPNSSFDLLLHKTTTVITIGGESGTMGWVDLWRDILLCDLLNPCPKLNTVPLPLPLKQMNSSEGSGIILGFPGTCRGIAYVEAERCIKFVEIQYDKNDGWWVKTSINRNMTNSWDDWVEDFQAKAKDIKIGSEFSHVISELHSHNDEAVAESTLQDLPVFQPGLSINNKQSVYLLTSGHFGEDEAWILELDIKNRTLVDVAKFGTTKQLFLPAIYCRGTIMSKNTSSAMATQGGNSFGPHLKFGNLFAQQYYETLKALPEDVHKFYRDESTLGRADSDGALTYVTTTDAINKYFLSVDLKDRSIQVENVDTQPSLAGGVLILVTGSFMMPDIDKHRFSQSFFLAPQENGGYFVLSDVLRYGINKIPVKDNITNSFGNESSQVKNGVTKIPEAAPAPPASAHKDVIEKSYASIVKNASTQPASIKKPKTRPNPTLKRAENVEKSSSVPAKTTDDQGYSIFVKNLPFNATVEMVEAEFRKFGTIKPRGIQVVQRQLDGFCFGFVEFESQQSMYAAIEAAKVRFGTYVSYVEEKRTPKRVINGVTHGNNNGNAREIGVLPGRGGYGNNFKGLGAGSNYRDGNNFRGQGVSFANNNNYHDGENFRGRAAGTVNNGNYRDGNNMRNKPRNQNGYSGRGRRPQGNHYGQNRNGYSPNRDGCQNTDGYCQNGNGYHQLRPVHNGSM